MAFATSSTTQSTPSTNNDSWKAQGFLNFYLPGKNGQRRKLGAIPLKDSKANEKRLRAWLEEDPSRVSRILANLEITYQSAASDDEHAFDLD